MKKFTRKNCALKYLNDNNILVNQGLTHYFVLNSYSEFLELIKNDESPCYYEYISDKQKIKLFMDIEIYKDKSQYEFETHIELVLDVKNKLVDFFNTQDLHSTFVILESHNDVKKSYHIIVSVTDSFGNNIYFENVTVAKLVIKELFPDLIDSKIVDTSVYREGLFRTIYSSKANENRPLVRSELSDHFDDLLTFVTYCPEPSELYRRIDNSSMVQIEKPNCDTPKELSRADKEIIDQYIRKNYRYKPKDIRDIFIDQAINCIIVALNDTFCFNVDKEHKSNHQYIVVDTYSSKQKCHDSDCSEYKYNEIKLKDFPKELNEIILKCLKVNKQEQELIHQAIQECKDYIHQNFDENIDEIEFDKTAMVFRGKSNAVGISLHGKCPDCNLEHFISDNGYCLKCSICNSIFPKNQLIPVDNRFKNLNTFWMKYNQLVNNGTVNININNYYGEEEFTCDVQLDNSIFNNKELTKLFNQILDGHKVVLVSELMSRLEINFKYTNGNWYYFDNSIWKEDKECLEFRKRILKLSNHFNRIQQFYENKQAGDTSNLNIIKNIKSLVNKLHKTGFEDEIIKGAKMYYNDESFMKNLNSKKHLVPFSNGVYDLLENKFRKTAKEDYVNLTVNFDYNAKVHNKEVYDFIEKILPNKNVRDYVLKKMSECLNGDIPNTNFLMFIGDGANGKSQLLNLMKGAMGELAEKVEVTLLTRKRNNANESNSEKIKLMNKRFAFLSEPEDGEKINIGLLKELTGSEEIVARGLYQESVSFVMETKLFLACNELPEIKGEDTALWRRIRVIDFPSRFVDEPKEHGEYKIDRTLPSRMREDITWRQTFMNILLDYYYKDIREPVEVQCKTNEYRLNNDIVNQFIEEMCDLQKNNKNYREFCVDLWNEFEFWKKENSIEDKLSQANFYNRIDYLTNYSNKKRIRKDDKNSRGWYGIKLKTKTQEIIDELL